MSKKSSDPLTRVLEKRPEAPTVTLRLKVPAEAWAAAKRSAVRRLEIRLAEIVTQTLRLAAKDAEDRG